MLQLNGINIVNALFFILININSICGRFNTIYKLMKNENE